MGGSTNTILHLLAAANEAEIDFKMADIDRLSRGVPCLAKVAPASQKFHMEDVHRAGVFALLAELDRAGLLKTDVPTIHSTTMKEAIDKWDIMNRDNHEARARFLAAPGGVRTTEAFSQSKSGQTLTSTVSQVVSIVPCCAYSADGGLAVLYGNIAERGCVVKTAGVDEVS